MKFFSITDVRKEFTVGKFALPEAALVNAISRLGPEVTEFLVTRDGYHYTLSTKRGVALFTVQQMDARVKKTLPGAEHRGLRFVGRPSASGWFKSRKATPSDVQCYDAFMNSTEWRSLKIGEFAVLLINSKYELVQSIQVPEIATILDKYRSEDRNTLFFEVAQNWFDAQFLDNLHEAAAGALIVERNKVGVVVRSRRLLKGA